MRAGIRDDRIRDRTITAYVDLDQFLENLDIPSNETIYWFVHDPAFTVGSSSLVCIVTPFTSLYVAIINSMLLFCYLNLQ